MKSNANEQNAETEPRRDDCRVCNGTSVLVQSGVEFQCPYRNAGNIPTPFPLENIAWPSLDSLTLTVP